MNRLLTWYCKVTIWLLKKYGSREHQADFVECLLEDDYVGSAYINRMHARKIKKHREETQSEREQFEKDKADMLKFLKDNPTLEVKLEEQDWVGFKLGDNGLVPPPVYQSDWPRMTRKNNGST